MRYFVVVGSTFDYLNVDHRLFLTMTILLFEPSSQSDQQRRLIVGITQDDLLKNKKHVQFLESWEDRQWSVFDFLLVFLNFHHQKPLL